MVCDSDASEYDASVNDTEKLEPAVVVTLRDESVETSSIMSHSSMRSPERPLDVEPEMSIHSVGPFTEPIPENEALSEIEY
jgi:hypothetical protein